MKHLIQFTTVLFFLIQTTIYSQTKDIKTHNTIKPQNENVKISTKNLNKFIGKFLLEEGNFIMEIVREKDRMYVITEFSKDQLLLKNQTTLHEFTRGVDFELIKDNKNALKFSQNGYETVLKRVDPKTKK